MPIVAFPTQPANVPNITLSSAKTSAAYTSNAWLSPPWSFVNGDFPRLPDAKPNPYQRFVFKGFSDTPQNITLTTSRAATTYTSNAWLSPPWAFPANSHPHLPDAKPNPYQPFVFLNFADTPPTVTDAESRMRITYESNEWLIGKVWAVKENISRPQLLKRGDPQPGIPGESVKRVIFVDKHDDGTMFYDGEIYRSMKMSQLISKFVGATGEEVTQVWEGEKQVAPDGNTYVFLASGVQDPDFPGGYGGYTDEQSRTVTLRSDRSIDVNFYYTAMELPPYNYLMRVAVPDGIAHIAIMKADVSSIKVKMHDGSICTVDIVLPDDEQASPIRVMLPTGIYALKKIEIND